MLRKSLLIAAVSSFAAFAADPPPATPPAAPPTTETPPPAPAAKRTFTIDKAKSSIVIQVFKDGVGIGHAEQNEIRGTGIGLHVRNRAQFAEKPRAFGDDECRLLGEELRPAQYPLRDRLCQHVHIIRQAHLIDVPQPALRAGQHAES